MSRNIDGSRSSGGSLTDSQIPALRLEGIGKRYANGPWVLQAVDLTVRSGELVALLGESGAGKTTLLNVAAGLEPCDAGQVWIRGESLRGLPDDARARLRRERLGFAFQAFHLLPHLTALQNVMVPMMLAGQTLVAARARAAELLEAMQMGPRADAVPHTLSGGEQQRVALARALAPRPALILADEPTGNLDPATASVALDLLTRQCRAQHAALLMVTHSAQAAAAADRRIELTASGLRPLP